MKKNPKKVFALIVAFALVLALVPAAALAAEKDEGYTVNFSSCGIIS